MEAVCPVMSRGRERLAKGISYLFAPPLVLVAAAMIIAADDWTKHCVAQPMCYYLAISVLCPMLLLAVMCKTGRVSDLDLTNRKERPLLLFVSSTSALTAWLALKWMQPEMALCKFAGAQAVCLIGLYVVSLRWKISIHAAAVAAFAISLVAQNGAMLVASGVLIGIVGWARITLGKHTPGQVIAGTTWSGLTFAVSRFVN